MERFWSKAIPEPNSGCWLWTSRTDHSGYGRYWQDGKHHAAHRVAWAHKHGPIPFGLIVRHKCDVPCCVNVEHMLLGTHADNVADKVARNRQAVGARSPSCRLSEDEVRQIRNMQGSHRAIGLLFGVSHNVVGRIKRRQLWKYLDA